MSIVEVPFDYSERAYSPEIRGKPRGGDVRSCGIRVSKRPAQLELSGSKDHACVSR